MYKCLSESEREAILILEIVGEKFDSERIFGYKNHKATAASKRHPANVLQVPKIFAESGYFFSLTLDEVNLGLHTIALSSTLLHKEFSLNLDNIDLIEFTGKGT